MAFTKVKIKLSDIFPEMLTDEPVRHWISSDLVAVVVRLAVSASREKLKQEKKIIMGFLKDRVRERLVANPVLELASEIALLSNLLAPRPSAKDLTSYLNYRIGFACSHSGRLGGSLLSEVAAYVERDKNYFGRMLSV